jgi:ketosteroid isomerase-like protein
MDKRFAAPSGGAAAAGWATVWATPHALAGFLRLGAPSKVGAVTPDRARAGPRGNARGRRSGGRGPEGVVYRGLNGNRQFWADIDAAWAEFRIEPEEFRDLGGQVLVLGRVFAHGRESGIDLAEAAGWLAGVREGQIVRFRSFSNQRDALQAAGLEE